MKKLFIFYTFFPLLVFSQGRIILNGGTISIQNGAHLVLQNNKPGAITILDSTSGIIINNASSRIRWHIGATSETYKIPFKHSNSLIPLSFTTSGAIGAGYFDLSTYHVSTWKSSDHLSPGIADVNSNGSDNSHNLLDRFWLIHAQAYKIKPDLTNLSFGYADIEWNANGNMISEPMLKAQRWNSILNTWSDYSPSGTGDHKNNLVNISLLSASDLFEWWVLVDADHPLIEEQKQGSKIVNRGLGLFNSLSVDKPGIKIFPNPVIDILTVDPGKTGASELQIIDVMGRIVHQQVITSNLQNIEFSNLSSGTYILQLIKGEMKWTYKIVKE